MKEDKEKRKLIELGTPLDAARAIQALVLCGWVIIAIVMKAIDQQDKTVFVLIGYYVVVGLVALIETLIRLSLKMKEES